MKIKNIYFWKNNEKIININIIKVKIKTSHSIRDKELNNNKQKIANKLCFMKKLNSF